MLADVKVPEVGESITEGTLVEWFKQSGDFVEIDDPLFELETDKVTLTVQAESAGKLEILVPGGERVKVGQVVARIDTAAARPAAGPAPKQQPIRPAPAGQEPEQPEAPVRPVPPPSLSFPEPAAKEPQGRRPETPISRTQGPPLSPPAGLAQARSKLGAKTEGEALSPSARRMLEEYQIDPRTISGTGRGGRITKEDVVRQVQTSPLEKARPPAVPPPPEGAPEAEAPTPLPAEPAPVTERQTRKPMSPLRQRIAERLVMAQQTAAILTTFNEADMTNVLAWRQKHRQLFRERYNIGLGLMSFFVKASVDALKSMPEVNAQIQGDEIVENHYYDIGVAISSDRGLVVPVIRDADKLGFAGIEMAIVELERKVRSRSITLSDLTGGVFTISNGGVFGSLMSTPILNPPQSSILGMHAIKKRPVVVDDAIVVRPMMYLALSYDHRLIDGREAVTFLKRIVQCVEDPERMLLEV
ncbi:MAG: 2-oxoglutarate dehydrogenase complex dihydrolipoyllysine-residue succinyltransferase [bacterium]